MVAICFQIPTRASRQRFWVARVFFRMAPCVDGERARQLANTLLGAKDGGRHQSGARIGVDELVVRYDVAP